MFYFLVVSHCGFYITPQLGWKKPLRSSTPAFDLLFSRKNPFSFPNGSRAPAWLGWEYLTAGFTMDNKCLENGILKSVE